MRRRRIGLTALTTATLLVGSVAGRRHGLDVPIGDPSARTRSTSGSQRSSLPLFAERVYPALEKFAKALNVKVRIAGPSSIDLAAFIATVSPGMRQGNPAGVIVVGGWDPALTEEVNKCIAAKVPTVVTDGDLSHRIGSPTSGRTGTSSAVGWPAPDRRARGARPDRRRGRRHLAVQHREHWRAKDCIRTRSRPAGIKVVAEEDNQSNVEQVAAEGRRHHERLPRPDGHHRARLGGRPGHRAQRSTRPPTRDPANELILTTNEAGCGTSRNVKSGLLTMVTMENYDIMNYLALFMLYTFHNDAIRIAGIDPWQVNWMPRSIDSGLFLVDAEQRRPGHRVHDGRGLRLLIARRPIGPVGGGAPCLLHPPARPR